MLNGPWIAHIFFISLTLSLLLIGFSYILRPFYELLKLNTLLKKTYSVSLTILHTDAIEEVSHLLDSLELNIKDKRLVRENTLYIDLNYNTSKLIHHVFIKRLLSVEGIGKITVI